MTYAVKSTGGRAGACAETAGAGHEEDLAYWVLRLEERPEAVELPCDRARPALKSPSYVQTSVRIHADVARRLTTRAIEREMSPLSPYLAAFAVYTGKIAGTRDFLVGVGVLQGTAAVPLVVHLDAQESFSVLTGRIDALAREASEHPQVSAEELVRALDIPRDPARHPLFDVGFGDQDPHGDLHVRIVLRSELDAAFILTCDANLFSQPMADRLARAFGEVLRVAADDAGIPVGKIPLLSLEESTQLLDEFSMPAFNWPKHFLLHELVEAKVDQTPWATAIATAAVTLTYAELEARANAVAHVLVARGVGPDSIVALVQERSPEMIVAVLGVLKAGGAYLPIEPDSPADRIHYLLTDSKVKVVLASSSLKLHVPSGVEVLFVDEIVKGPLDVPRLARRCEPHHLAYVIYTSGSTGRPKGVLIEHRNVVHLILAEKEDFGVRRSDALILLSSYTFDASIDQIWLALTSGAKLVIVDRETILDATLLSQAIARERITHLDTVPALLSGLTPAELPSIKRVVVGGETCPVAIARTWGQAVCFYNEYGPTEATVGSLRYIVDARAEMDGRVPIGRPIGATRAYVIDWGGCLVPIGVRGELCLGGAGVTRGYLNRDDLTREKFVPDPHVAEAHAGVARMYRTGDLVAWMPDGNVEFLGRADNQVKLRGFRIELGEIEAALLGHPDVSGAAVSVFGDSPETRRIACHFIAKRPLPKHDLHAFLGKSLPSYMLPDVFMQLDAFPKTVAGKIDRRKLPPPRLETGPVDLPQNRVEVEVRAIWSDLLRLSPEQISVTRSFFELGGHSLLITHVVSRIHKSLGVTLRVANILAVPTVRAIAADIAAVEPGSGASVPRADSGLALAVTPTQKGLYIIQQGNPRSTAYNLPLIYEVDGLLFEEVVVRACEALVERHESLRTAFFFQEGQILQRIAADARFKVERYDISEGGLEKVSAAFVQPFVLESPPLFRAAVLTRGERLEALAFDMHHIISDGMSIETLIEDFTSLVEGRALPDVGLRYFDYATWLASDVGRARLAAARAHWVELLKAELPVLDLPCDFRRPLSRHQGARDVTVQLDRRRMDAIAAYAHEHAATPFAFFAAAYSVFLSCVTGSADVVFGFPTAGRPHPDFERVVGMFVNSLVFRARIDGGVEFSQFVRQAMAQIGESLQNEDYPFDDLVEELRLDALPGRNPVFDTMLSYEGFTPGEYRCGAAVLRERRLSQRAAQLDLALVVRETASGGTLWFEYSADLFAPGTVERFAEEFTSIVERALEDRGMRLSEFHALTEPERALIVRGFNETDHALPPVQTVHELFERRAVEQPDAPAVAMGDTTWTYAQVDARAEGIASVLRQVGVGRGSIVGIILEPCPEMLTSVLGVLKAGGAFMPIDPGYSLPHRAHVIKDSRTNVLLTRGELADDLRGIFSGLVVDLTKLPIHAGAVVRETETVERGDLAYVVYTAGSTGQPTGVLVEHGSLLNFACWYADYLSITPSDSVSKYAGFGFDASIAEIVPAMISGARVVVVPAAIRSSAADLDQYLADQGVTVAFLPTQFGEQFLRDADKHTLRVAFLGGEKLRHRPSDRCTILNGYGVAECAVVASAFQVDKAYENIPIGKPVWNTQIRILDKLGRICAIGVPGELCISGAGVARGYLNQPVLMAERFVEDPFTPGRKMYRTGDLVRWLQDGNIEFLGRVDAQVKVAGFRIEFGKIEQALMGLDGVREATVVARKRGAIQGDVVLVAFITGSSTDDEEARKAELRRRVPLHMIPGRIIQLEEIPRTANGKVDKRRLPTVELDTGAVVAPRTETEAELRAIYAQVLGVPEASVGVTMSFLELGGHSLKAAALLSAIFRAKGLQLRLTSFLEASSVVAVARAVDAEQARARVDEAWETAPADRAIPLTSSQSRMFAVHQLASWSTAYNIASAWELGRDVDLDRVANALTQLVVRHDALRASFPLVDGMPQQQFAREATLVVRRLEVDDVNLLVTLDRLVEPFDLARAPLMRATIVSTETRRILAMDLHHIIADGVSVALLLDDLEALYDGRVAAPPKPTFADYVWWEQGATARQKQEDEKSWWLERFADLPDQLVLPYDFDRQPRLSFEGDEIALDLPAETTGPLLDLAKARSVTPLAVFLGAWSIVLSKLGNTPDIVVGVPASGRHARGTENIVGMFVNTVPLRLRLDAREPFSDYCARVGKEATEAFERQCYQLNDLVADLGLVRDPSRNPVFDVLFSWEDEDHADHESSLGLVEVPSDLIPAKFDLELTVHDTRRGLHAVLLFATKLFRRASAERFVAHLRRVLEQASRNPDLQIRDFRMLQPWEREMLLEDYNRTDVPVDATATVVDLFERHVKERPHAIAIEDQVSSLTYAEVGARSSVLARALANRGVGVDDVVALSMQRSRHVLAGIFGVMKVGAGYLPIDPEAPADRAQLMVADSGAKALVTDSATFGIDASMVLHWDALDWSGGEPFASRAEPSRIAYVIYTSGSTGRPKGVVIEHRNVVNFLTTSKDVFGITPDDRILLFSSLAFDASVEQWGLAIAGGARVVVPSKDTLLEHDAFEAFVSERGVTHLDTVPLFLSGLTPKRPLPLARIVAGGDICPVPVAARWAPGRAFFNEYGPTETTMVALRHHVSGDDLSLPRLPVGRPVANTHVYILDWTQNLAPLGVAGEMYIGGAGVARGYLNNDALTAERFLRSAYVQGERLYKTGDVARWRPDGTVDFLGRADSQVKIRGFRIELGEIEAALLRHPAVAEAAVVVVAEGDYKRLCAYVVARADVTSGELRSFLARALPSYMVPAAVVPLSALPVTTSGKIDRKRLPEPVFDEAGAQDAPGTEAEAKLIQLWSDVLKVPTARLPLEKSFFELGGHSLLIMLLITRIHQVFSVRLTPADVFDKPTIRGLAALIDERDRQAIVPIPKVSGRAHYPLSSVQRRLFAIQQASPDSVSYNMPTVFAVEGHLMRERFEEVVRALFHRHASLRTSFVIEAGEPVSRIAQSVPFSLASVESDELLDDLMVRLMQPFDLSLAPLVRAWLVRRSNGDELLIVDFHHIIVDGYSASILWREASDVLRGVSLPPLRIDYSDFAVWQASPEHQQELAQQRSFWLEQFATLPAPLQLPYDFRRPAVRNDAGDLVVVTMSKGELDALSALSRSQDATMFVTLLTAFFAFLSRIGGTDDLVVGIPTSGRVHPDIQDVVGMFVNTVPWRSHVPVDGTFLDFVATTRKKSIEFLSREEYQLESLVEDLGVIATAGRSPLFDVMFVFQAAETEVVDLGRLKLHVREFSHRTAKMDLVLVATELEAGLELAFEFPTELFERRTIERLAGHFSTMLRSVLSDPTQKLSALQLLTPEQTAQLLVDFNDTEHALPAVSGVHHLFDEWVARTPEAPAVVFGSVTWSYAEVNRRADAIASWLLDIGVKRDDVVGVLLDPCAEMLPSIWGVLKSGAAFLPIDAEYPVGRKNYMLEDSQARALLTRGVLGSDVAFDGPRLDVESVRPTGPHGAISPAVTRPEDAAYVIYTSGSTGKPKGVVIEHRNLLNFVLWYVDYYGITPGDGVSKYAGFGFDASISELFPASVSGATLVVVPSELRLAPRELSNYFDRNQVRVAFLPTQFGEQFMVMTENRSLRMVALGGEKLRLYRATAWKAVNAYGPTEYTVCTCAFVVDGPSTSIPIGRPVWNTQVLILDERDRLVPIGVAGELCVAGKSMARGYLNRPEVTSERFVAHPFRAGERMYRTGDLARWLPDGNIEFLGRRDAQVKVRGFRVELGEVEQTLLEQPGIADAAVIDATDESGTIHLVAYVVSSSPVDPQVTRAALARHLPDYMLPACFMQLESLPLTPNGKVDRRALPAADRAAAPVIVPASNEVERMLVAMWSRVLGLPAEKVSVTTSFLDLGGHSLKAIALASEVFRELKVDVRVSDIFRNPTVRALAARISRGDRHGSLGSIERRPAADACSPSSVQKRMFLLQQMEPQSVAYNLATLYAVAPGVKKDEVRRALAALVARHEAFRCSFVLAGTDLRAHVGESVELPLATLETTEAGHDEAVEALVAPFDLSRAPLARAAWVETERGAYLFFDMHHAVADAAAMGMLVEELTKILRGEILDEVGCSLFDCAAWEQTDEAVAVVAKQREYWRKIFGGGVPALGLLTDHARPPVARPEGDTVAADVAPDTLHGLRDLGRRHGLSLNSILLAAFNVFLARLTRQDEIVVGTPVAGRWHPDMQRVFGMFVNTLVLLNRPNARSSFLEFVQEVSTGMIDALDNQAFPFTDLVELVGGGRPAGHAMLFDVMFSMQSFDDRLEDPQALFTPCNVESRTAKFDLSLMIDEGRDDLHLAMEYRTSLFDQATIERFLSCFSALLDDVVRRPEAPLGSLSILTEPDRQLVEVEFNRTEVDYPEEIAAHRMFERVAARWPERRALVLGDRSYTYAAAEAAANRLAHRLVGLGVGRESIVAVLSPPSCELFLVELAALKAGAGFLPLDHRYPRDRLEYTLRDSGARVLVTARGLDADLDWPGPRLILGDSLFAEGPVTPPPLDARRSDLAYVIYTSGSTGRAKGVAVEHDSLVHFIQSQIDYYGLTERDRVSKYAGVGFDASIMEVFPALCCGAELHIVPEGIRLSPVEIADWLHKSGVTWSFLPPQFGEEFLRQSPETSLRWLVLGGDRLRKVPPARCNVVNAYGPTEFTVCATLFKVDAQHENIPIGKPTANTKAFILDSAGNLCPPGVPGELCLVGRGMTRGYLGSPEMTAKKFVAHPLAGGARMYHTGDLARWLDDGNVEFLGRIDSQVKIRGFRIELGEIEHAILEVAGVSGCAVVDWQDEAGDKVLCAYYVAVPDVGDAQIREAIARKLPDYMVPSAFVRLTQIPFTTSGKVDRRRLPAPELQRIARVLTPPENVAQALVVDAFARSLGQTALGIDDDFFELGGNSLKAVAVVAALASDFRITANDLFRLRTARAVAREIPMQRGDLRRQLAALVSSIREDPHADPLGEPSIASAVLRYRDRCQLYETVPLERRESYRNIFLTGATGFLGGYLLHDLLATTDAKIHVAVRAKSRKEAWDRLTTRAAYSFGPGTLEAVRRRVILVVSDLSKPSLGLDNGTLDALRRTIDCVIHSAALTKHYGDYSTFVAANVDATRNIIALARDASAHFNMVSTTSVAAGNIDGKKYSLFTEFDCDVGQVADNHYVRTKLEAEKAVVELRKSGLVANIFRVGFLAGDSRTLRFQENADDSGFVQQLRSFAALKCIPFGALTRSFCPVNEVSAAILALLPLRSLSSETHHIENFLDAAAAERIAQASDICRAVDDASFYEWLAAHLEEPGIAQAATAVLLHEGLLAEQSTTEVVTMREKTERLLARVGFSWGEVAPEQVWSLVPEQHGAAVAVSASRTPDAACGATCSPV